MAFLQDYEAAQKQATSALIDTTRTATQIAEEDPSFLRTTNFSFGVLLDQRTTRLLSMMEKLLRRSSPFETSLQSRLDDLEAIDTNWKPLIDAADSLLERADSALDEYKGYIRSKDSPIADHSASTSYVNHLSRPARNLRDMDIPKPQLLFPTKPANFESKPFRPLLTNKPHAEIPLKDSLDLKMDGSNGGMLVYPNPYEAEIKQFRCPENLYRPARPTGFTPFKETQATWVETEEGLQEMIAHLRNAQEVAIDLEHHDSHSYIGLVSLMQISTRECDWIIDTLKPWRRKLEALNEVFANPSIIKILHGSNSDVIWLQRDFGLYIVGLFDTYHASKVLHYPKHGLAYLLEKFVKFSAQKQYQMADWRIRPLPPELFDYARSDTHFLLYIFDCIRGELLNGSTQANNLLSRVFELSKIEALQTYQHPFYTDAMRPAANSWFSSLRKAPRMQSDAQLAVFVAVHKWRDAVARQEDESPHSIMPIWVLHGLVMAMPSDRPTLTKALPITSKFVRPRIDELLHSIREAKLNIRFSLVEVDKAMAENRFMSSKSSPSFTPHPVGQEHTGARLDTTRTTDVRAKGSQFWGSTLARRNSNPRIPTDEVVQGLFNCHPPHPDPAPETQDINPNVQMHLAKHSKRKAPTDVEITGHLEPATRVFNRIDQKETIDLIPPSKRVLTKAECKAATQAKRSLEYQDSQVKTTPGTMVNYADTPLLIDDVSLNGSQKNKAKAASIINPYAKAATAPGGLKRSAPKAGKSSTFKS